MIKHISLENFKCFGERVEIPMAPITLIFGENSAGKSSILQFLTVLKQTLRFAANDNPFMTRGDKAIIDIGGFADVLFDRDTERQLSFRLEGEKCLPIDVSLAYDQETRGAIVSEVRWLDWRADKPRKTNAFRSRLGAPWAETEDNLVVLDVVEKNPCADALATFAWANRELLLKGIDKLVDVGALASADPHASAFWAHIDQEIAKDPNSPRGPHMSALQGSAESTSSAQPPATNLPPEYLFRFVPQAIERARRLPAVATAIEKMRTMVNDMVESIKTAGTPAELAEELNMGDRVGTVAMDGFSPSAPSLTKWSLMESLLRLGATNVSLCPWNGRSSRAQGEPPIECWCIRLQTLAYDFVSERRCSGPSYFTESFDSVLPSLSEFDDPGEIASGFSLSLIGGEWLYNIGDGVANTLVGTEPDQSNADRLSTRQYQCQHFPPSSLSDRDTVKKMLSLRRHWEALSGLRVIGPLRNPGQRWYVSQGSRDTDTVGFKGENTLELLSRLPELRAGVNRWLTTLGVDYEVDVKHLHAEIEGLSLMLLRDKRRGNAPSVTLADVGTGVSQILPIVAETVAAEGVSILIEQPELHIHPRLQAELGSLFAESVTKRNNQIIVETHSEHLMLRIQRLIRTKKLMSTDVSVLYVSRSAGGSKVEELRLDKDGEFADLWPGGFFPERLNEAFGE